MTDTQYVTPAAKIRSGFAVNQWFGATLVLCFASTILVDVPMPLSRSGSLEVTLGDFVGAVLWAWLALLVVRRRWRPQAAWKIVLVVTALFLAWFVVVEAVRFARGDEVLQPVLILRTTLIPVVAYLIVGADIERAERTLNALVVFMAALTLWHLGEWHSMRMSDFLGNSIVYVGLLVMMLPVSVFVASGVRSRPPGLVRAAAWVNMLAALVLPVWAGSRGVSAVAFVAIVCCLFIMLGNRRFTSTLVGIGIVATLIQAAIWWFNPMGSAYGVYRLVPPPSQVFPSAAGNFRSELDEAQRETALAEMNKSDAGRAELREASLSHIREDPLIGDGVVYFELPDDGVTQQYAAHNLVLEHLNAYGAIGFAGYLAIFAGALWPVVTWVRRRRAPRHAPLMALVTTAAFLGFSLTQPTSLIMTIMVPYFAAIGGLLAPVGTSRDTPSVDHAPAETRSGE